MKSTYNRQNKIYQILLILIQTALFDKNRMSIMKTLSQILDLLNGKRLQKIIPPSNVYFLDFQSHMLSMRIAISKSEVALLIKISKFSVKFPLVCFYNQYHLLYLAFPHCI